MRLPSYEQVRADPVLYAHAARVFHLETNPVNARAQAHGNRLLWLNPPPIPLSTGELDRLFELPFARRPHSSYGAARIPAWGRTDLIGNGKRHLIPTFQPATTGRKTRASGSPRSQRPAQRRHPEQRR